MRRAATFGKRQLKSVSSVILRDAVSEDAVDKTICWIVRFEIDAVFRGSPFRVLEGTVLDEQVLGGNHRDSLPMVSIRDAVADHNVMGRNTGRRCRYVDSIPTPLS